MPGNIIKINNSEELEWYVEDSKMEELMKFLDKVGYKRYYSKRAVSTLAQEYGYFV